MAKSIQAGETWARSIRAVPEWAQQAEELVARCLASPRVPSPAVTGLGFEAVSEAACADLLRRFAAPLRVADVGDVRIVSMLDALVFVHDRARRQVCVGAWQPDGTLAVNTLGRIEIGWPLAGFAWLDVLLAQWQKHWTAFAPALRRRHFRNRVRNALKRWIRDTLDMKAQRKEFGEALELDPRAVWMTERLERRHRGGWLFADRYNAVGRNFSRLEWVLADSPPLFRLVGLALLDAHLVDPDEPVASTLQRLRALGVSEAAWRAACRFGARLFDTAIDSAANPRLFETCVEVLRMIEHTDLLPPPVALQKILYWQHSLRDSNQVHFKPGWCSFQPWFLRHAARAARDALSRNELHFFLDGEFLPAVDWLTEVRPSPDANQLRAGWRWIDRARSDWACDPARIWEGSGRAWASALVDGYCGGYNVFPLGDPKSMIEEGRAMHHCIALFIEDCLRGQVRAFSLRDVNTGERVLTAMLRRVNDDEWVLADARMRMNRKAKGLALSAALLLSCRYGQSVAKGLKAA